MTSRRKDQGWAWLVAFSACMSRALHDGIQKAMGVLLTTLAAEFNQDIFVIGLTVSLMTVVGGIAAVITGPLTNILQPYQIVTMCGISTCIGISACALASSWITCAFCLVVLTGIPMRIVWVTLLSSLNDYFEEYYPVANCIAFTGGAIGMAVFAPLTQFFLDSYGLRGALALLGSISLHLIICGMVLKTPQDGRSNPVYLTLATDTNKHKEEGIITRFLNWINATLEFGHFKNPAFLVCLSVVFALGYSLMGWTTYLVPYGESRGLAPYSATSLATAGGIAHVVGSIIIALLLKSQINPLYIVTIALSISGCAMLLYPVVSNRMSELLAVSCLYGLTSTSYIALMSVCKELIGGQLIQSISWLSVAAAVGIGFSGFVTGWIFDMTGSYNIAFVILGGVLLSVAVVLGVTVLTTHTFFKRK